MAFLFQLQALCFTYGIMFGSGASLVYTPSLAIIGHYFKKRLGIANGIVAAGSPTVSMVLPHLLAYVLKKVSVSGHNSTTYIITAI